jgi:hypothetical protein
LFSQENIADCFLLLTVSKANFAEASVADLLILHSKKSVWFLPCKVCEYEAAQKLVKNWRERANDAQPCRNINSDRFYIEGSHSGPAIRKPF